MRMYIASSIVLFAVGAILKFAVSAQTDGVNLHQIGVILMVVSAVGFVVAVIAEVALRSHRSTRTVQQGGEAPLQEDIRQH